MNEGEFVPPWPSAFFDTVQSVRVASGLGVRESVDFMATELGFPSKDGEGSEVRDYGWCELRDWLYTNKIDLTLVRGPYVLAMLRALAIRHGRIPIKEDEQ